MSELPPDDPAVRRFAEFLDAFDRRMERYKQQSTYPYPADRRLIRRLSDAVDLNGKILNALLKLEQDLLASQKFSYQETVQRIRAIRGIV